MAAPVKETCPDINRMQRELRRAISDLRSAVDQVKRFDDEDASGVAADIDYAADAIASIVRGDLEEIRDSNNELRKWGQQLEAEPEEARSELAEALQELEKLSEDAVAA